jgi:hypothetical protein
VNELFFTGTSLSTDLERRMRAPKSSTAIRVDDPSPFGDVTLVPATATGRSELEMARAMAAAVTSAAPASDAEILRRLRNAFPHSPLTLRVTALGVLMRRARMPFGS